MPDPPGVESVAAEEAADLLSEYGVNLPPANRMAVLSKAGAAAWGTASARSFSDRDGPGWLLDLSGSFGGCEIYALVRSVGPGQRSIVKALSADDADRIVGGNQGVREIAEAEPVGANESQAEREPERRSSPAIDPGAPSLVVWPGEPAGKRMPGNAVSTFVQGLLREGVDPEAIEVWTNMKRPKISVILS